ncbi:protein decapping 5-like isoform X1 [Salvia splendens]|uniref:protein decapping 5-like isoform X1 n=1 Tax=Salvia splendens TaxID=180675 RepID=UPI001C255D52|nr:protein decapping 5-like isoform X1 [Salvia splendens]
MSKEPSCNANNATSQPSPSSAGDSFIGSFISVMSKSEIRYEGILYFLNPQDSTFGLKDVRTFGTEGRRNDGKEVPPSDRVFEYILFRGSDIKDVKVITNPLVQKQEKLHNDPAIIESNYHIPPYSSSHSVSPVPGYSTESKFHSESSGLNARSHLNMLPSNPSGSQMGWGSSQSTHSGSSSYDIPTGPTQWQGYHAAPGGTSIAQQHPLSSAPMTHLLQNPASTAMAMTNMPDFVPSGYQLAASSSSCLNSSPNYTSEQLLPSMLHSNSLSSEQSQPLYNSTTINSRGLTQPLPLAYQNTGSIEAQAANKVVPDHASALPAQFLPYSASSGMGQISNSFLGAPNPSHPRLSEYSMSNNLYAEPNDVTGTSSNSPNFLSSAAGPAVHPPLLPLPPTAQKLQSPLQFTEEFDFEAMNEKFKKEEVWGYLGKANQRENIDGMQSAINSQEFGDDKLDLISKSDPKPAYSKDDFFDTISCNSLGWGTRDGQNQLSERVKLNSETFGYFERRSQFGYGGQRSGHGQHRGPYNWGRGYNYGYRGHGRYT